MLSKNIYYKNYKPQKSNLKKIKKIKKILNKVLKEDNQILASLNNDYKDSYNKKFLLKFKKKNQITIIGMGGSILGAKAIFNFL